MFIKSYPAVFVSSPSQKYFVWVI